MQGGGRQRQRCPQLYLKAAERGHSPAPAGATGRVQARLLPSPAVLKQGLQLRLWASVSPSITWDDDSSVPRAPCPAPSSPAYPKGAGHVQPLLHPHGSSPELLRTSLGDSRQGEGRKGPLEACGCQHLRTSGHQLRMTTGRLPRKVLACQLANGKKSWQGWLDHDGQKR